MRIYLSLTTYTKRRDVFRNPSRTLTFCRHWTKSKIVCDSTTLRFTQNLQRINKGQIFELMTTFVSVIFVDQYLLAVNWYPVTANCQLKVAPTNLWMDFLDERYWRVSGNMCVCVFVCRCVSKCIVPTLKAAIRCHFWQYSRTFGSDFFIIKASCSDWPTGVACGHTDPFSGRFHNNIIIIIITRWAVV